MKNDQYLAHGVESIYRTLKTMNEKARDPKVSLSCCYRLLISSLLDSA